MNKLKIEDSLIRLILLTFFLFIIYNFILIPSGFLQPLRLGTNDALSKLLKIAHKASEPTQDIVVVKIDEETLLGIEKKWPWNRALFADVIEKISSYRPKFICVDITFFGESTDKIEDERLKEAITKAGNVILPSYITEKGDYLTPYTPFSEASCGYGFVNKIADVDYRVRRARLVYRDSSTLKTYFSFETIIAGALFGVVPDKISYKNSSVIIKEKDLTIPVSKRGTIYINYLPIQHIPNVSLLDIMRDKAELKNFLNNKVVLLGTSSKPLQDIHQTPQGMIPGIFINTLTLNTILAHSFVLDVSDFIILPILLLVIILTAVYTYRCSLTRGIVFFAIEIAAILALFSMALYFNRKLDYFSILFLLVFSWLFTNSYKYGYLVYFSNKLKSMVIRDGVTGLAAARYFQFKLQMDISRIGEAKEGISVVVFSIPEFQDLQKKHSRDQLDLMLRQFSQILKQNSRKKVDLLARWKEDKFAAILVKTGANDALIYTQKIITKIEQNEFLTANGINRLTICAGISNYPAVKTDSAATLIACAEAASNRSKLTHQKITTFDSQQDKIRVEIMQKKLSVSEEDYLTTDIAEREKELLSALDELKRSQQEIQTAHFETILSLVKALEEKDPYTAGHSERVADYAVGIAKNMGLEEPELTLISQSALLHDVGKFGLPDEILHKKEKLTEEELTQIKKHPVMGSRILEKSKFFEKHIPLIMHHHERYDGKGYPHGLSGKFIPRGAQIIAIADAIDAMTTGRGYNHVLNVEETVEELKKSEGSHFASEYIQPAINFILATKLRP